MVLTPSQYKNMSKEELIQELADINSGFVNNINTKLTCLKSLTTSHQNMIKSILSCSNVKASTLIYSPESFNWSIILFSTVEERQLFVRHCH